MITETYSNTEIANVHVTRIENSSTQQSEIEPHMDYSLVASPDSKFISESYLTY